MMLGRISIRSAELTAAYRQRLNLRTCRDSISNIPPKPYAGVRQLTDDSSIKRSTSRAVGSNNSQTTNPFSRLPSRITFEDFLRADTNRDGRVTAAEWENYVRSKGSVTDEAMRKGVTVHFPTSPKILKDIIESNGFGITINGLHYTMNLKPEGTTIDLIKNAEQQLVRLDNAIAAMEMRKAPLDAAAARHVRRVMSALLGYLVLQAGVVAKLTFYSRFGWDIMEPITYFLTFGISLVGLTFFTWNRLEFSYPALAALVARRKAIKLYSKNDFDEEAYLALKRDRERVQLYLEALIPSNRIFELEQKTDK